MKHPYLVILTDGPPPGDLGFPRPLGVGDSYVTYAADPQAAATWTFDSVRGLTGVSAAHVLEWGTWEPCGVFRITQTVSAT